MKTITISNSDEDADWLKKLADGKYREQDMAASQVIKEFQGQYRFLSNFWSEEGEQPVEFVYQAAKTDDPAEKRWILEADSPGEAKRRSRKITLRKDWDAVKVAVMLQLLRTKFSIPSLRDKLLSTGTAGLVEGNRWHDNFWGVCNCGHCSGGQNILGKLLMQIREELL